MPEPCMIDRFIAEYYTGILVRGVLAISGGGVSSSRAKRAKKGVFLTSKHPP